ncbi:MAG TPA: hypothetical protein VFU33_07440 [Gaiellaceae bacterium]|nr:hypothetical protein [Gaiellaceae bacterium]
MKTAAPAWVFGVGVSLLALSACGSSHRASYSVPQVESAFASQGIRLHPGHNRSVGVVLLVGRRGVRVLVDVERVDYSVGWTGERPTVRGNVTAFRGSTSGRAVEAALRELQ